MQHHEIGGVFSRTYNGQRNFLTPGVLAYGKRGRMVWELSVGRGLSPETMIYGVTVIELPNIKRRDLSHAFGSLEEAEAYIRSDFGALTT